MKILLSLALAALFALTAAADVNVTGNWTGTFTATGPDGQSKDSGALLVLKQDGNEITGTAGPDENERFNIKKGTIEGNKITLDVDAGEHVLHVELTLTEDRLQGTATAQGDSGELRAKLDLKRAN
ncbi:MAG TPA: hypothetical protein VKX45_12095 [Bryobacteraceae bacterium]|jgi:hypothetical protein|nr:hypothetical protein [Bryobacteraceae bacterium]